MFGKTKKFDENELKKITKSELIDRYKKTSEALKSDKSSTLKTEIITDESLLLKMTKVELLKEFEKVSLVASESEKLSSTINKKTSDSVINEVPIKKTVKPVKQNEVEPASLKKATSSDKSLQLTAELEELKGNYKKALQENEKLKQEIAGDLTMLNEKIGAKEGEFRFFKEESEKKEKALLAENTELKNENNKLKNEIIEDLMRMEEMIEKKEEQFKTTRDKLSSLSEEYKKSIDYNDNLKREYDDMKKEWLSEMEKLKESSKWENEFRKLKDESEKKINDSAYWRKEFEEQLEKNEKIKEDFSRISKEKEELQAELTILREEIKSEIDMLEKEIEKKELQFQQDLGNKNELESTINKLTKERNDIENGYKELVSELNEKISQLNQSLQQPLTLDNFKFMLKRYARQYPELAKLFTMNLIFSKISNLKK